MELQILYEIQKLHCSWLDAIMIGFTNLANHGELWILIALVLLFRKKTRACGAAMLLSLMCMQILGNEVLKPIFARQRPCWVDPTVPLLLKSPASYSFPSGHTFSSFAGAFVLYFYHKRFGILALVVAAIIAFSRMYLFVHYPTDILAGMVLGYVTARVATEIVIKIEHRLKSRQ